ncbi:hypothetical protein [Fischerella thermalis]|uniref:hypothetical protein n=1 Tax=Fischerella thermalis TaxID=372787 RepID=UPI00307D2936
MFYPSHSSHSPHSTLTGSPPGTLREAATRLHTPHTPPAIGELDFSNHWRSAIADA